ncbi:MAG TPA: ATP-binding protein, partial [Flavobacteriaceae bacterium]
MNQSIKAKLVGGFTIILLILISLAFFMTNKLSEMNDRLVNIVDASSKKISLSQEILIDILTIGRQEKNMILEESVSKKEIYHSKMNEALSAIDKKIPEMQELVDEKGAKDLAEFKTLWKDYKIFLNEIVELAIKNESEKAFDISGRKGFKTREEAIDIMERIIDRNEKSMTDDKIKSIESYKSSLNLIIVLIILGLVISIVISYWIIQGITKRISFIAKEAEKIASREFAIEKLEDKTKDELKPIFNSLININESFREVTENANSVASGDYAVDLTTRSDKDLLGNALNKMTRSLRETTATNEKHNWLATGQNQLNEKLMGDQIIEELASNTISFLCTYLKANIGAVYLFNEEDNALALNGQYAFSSPKGIKEKFALNEGLIGQAAREQKQISLKDVTDEQLRITSSVLNANPKQLLITPFLFEGATLGVIEIGRLSDFNETEKEFINASMESIAISVNSAIARKRIQELLEETRVQSEELQTQQEELKQMNEELEEQTQNLKQQQEELQMTNEELEEQTQSLEMKNKEVEAAKYDIEQKTKQLEISSKYKSEFLSNMSHELRTPLNSLLILSKDLSENKNKNLNQDQVESAEIIYKSGHDLLVLINEVLDLSKIEAGKMPVNIERVTLRNFTDGLLRDFKRHAEQKGLKLTSKLDVALPESIRTDPQRLNQILKNFLSNAIKFTEKGRIDIRIARYTENTVIISVSDTGIGIKEEKQMTIFEAFQQADGGTSRKYGGTGLGLSISQELAKLLGAEIKLNSKFKEGSTFSIILPLEIHHGHEHVQTSTFKAPVLYKAHNNSNSEYLNYPALEDDRDTITKGDKTVLVIEDDLQFAAILLKQANKKGFKCLSAAT